MVKVSTGGEDANIHPIHGHHGLDSAKAEIYEAEKRAEDVKPPLRKGGMQGGLCPYRGKMLEYAASIRIAKPTTAGHNLPPLSTQGCGTVAPIREGRLRWEQLKPGEGDRNIVPRGWRARDRLGNDAVGKGGEVGCRLTG